MPDEQPATEQRPQPRRSPRSERTLPALTPNRLLLILVGIVAVFAFTALVGLVVLAFAAREPPTAMQTLCGSACNDVVKMSLGAIVGLVGGAAAGKAQWEYGSRK